MDYMFLDAVPWEYSQALYHAAAHLGREALFILRPATPYICIGYHQDAQKEIDLEFAAQNGIPVFRREVGGGAVYLDGQQLFFQLMLRRDNPIVPASVADFYRKFLQPVIATFRDFGIPAEYKPVNDIITSGRKISGTGAAQIEDIWVLVGNFIQDFNYEMMSKVLRLPDEKFRDKVHKTMYGNLTTMLRETGSSPSNPALAERLIANSEPLMGPFVEKRLDDELRQKADELIKEMHTPAWLLANDNRRLDAARVKIAEGIFVFEKVHKAPGGLIRLTAVSIEGKLTDVHLSGDFFFFPAEKLVELEKAFTSVPIAAEEVIHTVTRFYAANKVESPGVTAEDFATLISG
jgi:lipoate-protein ligase A